MNMEGKRILYTNDSGILSVIIPAPTVQTDKGEVPTTLEHILATPSIAEALEGKTYEVVDADKVPTDRVFRNAWRHDTTDSADKVSIDLAHAKEISHEIRRAARAAEFAPLDVKATIPAEAAAAESQRVEVRTRYAELQVAVDGCADAASLRSVLEAASLVPAAEV